MLTDILDRTKKIQNLKLISTYTHPSMSDRLPDATGKVKIS